MRITKGGRYSGLISNVPASGVTISDPGGLSGGDPLTLQEFFDLIAGGTLGAYLTVTLGGQGTVQALGTLGATPTIDLANGNKFWGTLDQACTISTTGWTNLKDAQISVELIQDGTGGWTPTFSGVTWIGGTPTWDTTAGTVTHIVLFSRDGGTTIYGAVVGGAGLSDTSLVTVAASGATETIDVSVARTYDVTLTANCTLTLSGAVTAEAWFVTLLLRQDGTGSRIVTWPGSVVWPGGVTPTLSTAASAVDVFTLFTLDGGTVWFGFPTGGSGSGGTPATTVTDETTFGITPAVGTDTEYARQDHTHGSPAASAISSAGFVGAILIADTHSTPIVFADLLTTEDGSDLLYADI